MGAKTFKAGEEVFSTDGRMGRYVAHCHEGHIVQPMHDDEDSGAYFEGVDLWPTVHAKPPEAVLHAEIGKLEEKAAALRAEIFQMESQKRDAARDQQAVKDRIGIHQALSALDALMSGAITHYVTTPGGDDNRDDWGVYTQQEFRELRTHYSTRSLRLWANVNSDSRVNLTWKFSPNHEREDDGARDIFPFTNEADARAKLVEIAHAMLAEAAKHSNFFWLQRRVGWAAGKGIPIPAEVTVRLSTAKRADAQATLDKARTELSRAEAALAAVS